MCVAKAVCLFSGRVMALTPQCGKQRGPREGGAGIWADSQREPELGQYPRRWRETDEVEIFRGKISRTGG